MGEKRLARAAVVLGGLALVAGLVLSVDVRLPSRPERSIDALAELRNRDDLNVIFILVDTLRADHLGVYGYERDTSPFLDQMTASGVGFADVQRQSTWTKSSMASLWLGAYPARTGVLRHSQAIPEAATLPAEILSDAGFRTVGIWRTLLDLLGLPALPGAQGRSLVPLMQAAARGEEPAPERPSDAQLDRTWGQVDARPLPLVSVIRGDLRLFHRPNAPRAAEL